MCALIGILFLSLYTKILLCNIWAVLKSEIEIKKLQIIYILSKITKRFFYIHTNNYRKGGSASTMCISVNCFITSEARNRISRILALYVEIKRYIHKTTIVIDSANLQNASKTYFLLW